MRPTPTHLLIVFTALAGLTALSRPAAPGADSPPGDPAKGKKLYATRCVACHQPNGSGGIKLTGNPTPDFRDAKRMAAQSDSVLRDCISNGRMKSGMIAWSKQGVKPIEIEHLIAYVRTFSAPRDSSKAPR